MFTLVSNTACDTADLLQGRLKTGQALGWSQTSNRLDDLLTDAYGDMKNHTGLVATISFLHSTLSTDSEQTTAATHESAVIFEDNAAEEVVCATTEPVYDSDFADERGPPASPAATESIKAVTHSISSSSSSGSDDDGWDHVLVSRGLVTLPLCVPIAKQGAFLEASQDSLV